MKRGFALCILIVLAVACADRSEVATQKETPGSTVYIIGNIVTITVSGSAIDSFTIDDGESETEVFIKEGFDYGFKLNHLYSHKETQEPVSVTIENEDGKPFAIAIEDA